MEQFHLNVASENGELVVRTGSALPLKEPERVILSGILNTPAEYIKKRVDSISVIKTNVVFDYTARTITLTVDDCSFYKDIITGKLEINKDLASLGINNDTLYNEKELSRKLTFFGRFFESKAAYNDLIKKLNDFSAKVKQEFTNATDYRGSEALEKITKIEHDIPLFFVLKMPIFNGGDKREFKVNIYVAARDGGIELWLESVELHELLEKETESLFNAQLKNFEDYVIVKKY
jgi:hypothetical protein